MLVEQRELRAELAGRVRDRRPVDELAARLELDDAQARARARRARAAAASAAATRSPGSLPRPLKTTSTS